MNLLQDLVNTRPKVELGSPFLVERQSLQVQGEAGVGRRSKAGLIACSPTHKELSSLLLWAQPAYQSRNAKARGQSEPASQEDVLGPFFAGKFAVSLIQQCIY